MNRETRRPLLHNIRVRDALNITGANTHDAVHPDLTQG